MSANQAHYIGRFAPSPTGPLHFGSLIAAVASYADALHHQGKWLVRMEDVDEGRVVRGADHIILSTLEHYGFHWQDEVVYQSQKLPRYQEIIQQLLTDKRAYPCSCTRKQIMATGKPGAEGIIYPGACRDQVSPRPKAVSVRVRTNNHLLSFTDRIQGPQSQKLATEVGDFLIRRGDGYTAYQLAVVVDDWDQGITHVVRGADLLFSTPRQLLLQQLLNFSQPQYAHVPLAVDQKGRKLSKQGQAPRVSDHEVVSTLLAVWRFLGQVMPEEAPGKPESFWRWAATHWAIHAVPRVRQIIISV